MGRRAWRALAVIGLCTCVARLAVAADGVPAPPPAPPTTTPPPPPSMAPTAPSLVEAPSDVTGAPAPGANQAPVVSPQPPSDVGAASPIATAPLPPPWENEPHGKKALLEAESAVLDVDYERSLVLSQQAIRAGGLSRDELRRAYLSLALSAAQLDRADVALPAFLRLLALDPDVELTRRLAPARRNAALTAQRYWSGSAQRLELNVSFNREARQLVVNTTDPLGWIGSVRVWVRKPGTEFIEYPMRAGKDATSLLDAEPLDVLELHALGFDDHGNVVVEHGSADEPQRLEPQLADVLDLQRDIRSGETGSVATRLSTAAPVSAVGGYVSLDLGPSSGSTGATFDLGHATLYLRSQLSRRASVELAVDAQHLARDHRDVVLPHAFVDIAVRDWLVLRPGLFEAPIGVFNEYLWPAFVRTTGAVPLFSTLVVPGLWSELGVQVRGRIPVWERAHLTYAAFVSNGLEQPDDRVGDGVVAEGGDLMAMRYNARDEHNADKGVGGRVGLRWGRFDIGASGYTGRYTIDANRRLTIVDFDVSYESRFFTFRTEAAAAFQDVSGGWRTKAGAYALVSSRIAPHLEPYLQYDFLNDRRAVQHRLLFGNALYVFPHELAARTLRLKTEVGVRSNPDTEFVWLTQLVSGF